MMSKSAGYLSFLFVTLAVTTGPASLPAQEKPQQEVRERGAAIRAAAVEAAGSAALGKIESVELTARRQTYMAPRTVETERQVWLAYPAQLRVEESVVQSSLAGGSDTRLADPPYRSGPITPVQTAEKKDLLLAEGYDGNSGWRKTAKGTEDFAWSDWVQLSMDLEAGALGAYRRAAEGKMELSFSGEQEVQGQKVQAAEWRLPVGSMQLYFDPQTHLLVGMKSREVTTEGTFEVLHWWSDYRRVSFKSAGKEEAVRIPFTLVTYRDGKKYYEEKIKKLKLNTRVDPKLFAKPK